MPVVSIVLALLNGLGCSAATLHVWQNNPSPAPPYASWNSAATNIQDEIDAAGSGDEILVTNGVYASGGQAVHGTLTNRVAVTKPVALRSVNGPAVTIIRGHRVLFASGPDDDIGVRCVYLTNGATHAGFTLTNGCTRLLPGLSEQRLWCISNVGCALVGDVARSGGAVWCEPVSAIISNCVLTGNFAWEDGGGALGGTLIQ